MKKFTSLLIGVSLALAGAAFAQQPEEQASPKKEKPAAEKTQPAEPKTPKTRGANLASPEATAPTQHGAKGAGVNAKTSPRASPAAAATASAAPSVAASASAAPSVAATGQQTAGGNAAVKADPQKVQQVKQQAQQIKQQHANFRAQPRPDKVPPVTYNQNYRIQGSDQWQGTQYQVFRSYHPERHDQGWYRSHYNRVELIGGGYYFWNA